MKKVLIITYYWPPSGGAGVQRWVKLAKYLVHQGIQVHVLTVDEAYASYLQTDPSMVKEIHPDIKVVKTRSVEIINVFAYIFGKKNVPTAGFYNLDKKSFIHNLGLIIRSSLFIPDPRRGWNFFAFRKASQIIKKEGITKVITSSPPHSSQLIGLRLKKKFEIEWIADLRDPWTDIFYYSLLRHNFLSKILDSYYEHSVLLNADRVFTVSQHLKELFISKDHNIDPDKFFIIPNGFDESDFTNLEKEELGHAFSIGYTGTMSDQYDPRMFLNAFSNLVRQTSGNVLLEITGSISPNIIEYIRKLGVMDYIKINSPVAHQEIPGLLTKMSALLLVIPRVKHAELILTGKLFEYLAARRPIILIGPENGDAASIVNECAAGSSFDWEDESKITRHLLWLKNQHDKGLLCNLSNENIVKYSRKEQALQINNILFR